MFADATNFNEIYVPREEKKKSGVCWYCLCPIYYFCCCCLCCEQGFRVTKMRFIQRFQKWVNIVSAFVQILHVL